MTRTPTSPPFEDRLAIELARLATPITGHADPSPAVAARVRTRRRCRIATRVGGLSMATVLVAGGIALVREGPAGHEVQAAAPVSGDASSPSSNGTATTLPPTPPSVATTPDSFVPPPIPELRWFPAIGERPGSQDEGVEGAYSQIRGHARVDPSVPTPPERSPRPILGGVVP